MTGRVLILVENLPVPLDRRVWQEACALRDAGLEVTVICPKMKGYTQAEEILDGIRIYRHWIAGEGRGIAGFVAEYASALWGELICSFKARRNGGNFDIIHLCNPPDLLFLVALPHKLFFRSRILFDVHDLWPEMFEAKFNKKGLFYRAVRLAESCTLKLSSAVIATNESVRSIILKRSKKLPEKVTVVRTAPNTLDTGAPEDPSLRQGKPFLVGYIGVMGDADGVGYLLDAADHIAHGLGRTDIHFLLMGSGPEYPSLCGRRDDLKLKDHVDMPGRVSNEFLFSALQTMDLGVACDPINAYNDHCTMNKTLEYMAFGKPQVMFGTVEGKVSAGDAAAYVMENDAKKLGEAIVALLDSPEERTRMGKAGRKRLQEELGWDRSTQALCSVYQSLLSEKYVLPPDLPPVQGLSIRYRRLHFLPVTQTSPVSGSTAIPFKTS